MSRCSMPLCERSPGEGRKMCGPCWMERRDLERSKAVCEYCHREPAAVKRIIPGAFTTRKQRELGLSCAWRLHRQRVRSRSRHIPVPFAGIEHSYEVEREAERPRRRPRPRGRLRELLVDPWRGRSR